MLGIWLLLNVEFHCGCNDVLIGRFDEGRNRQHGVAGSRCSAKTSSDTMLKKTGKDQEWGEISRERERCTFESIGLGV